MSESALYEGRVRHRRFDPVEHEFEYRIFMAYLDLAELPQILDPLPLWSARRAAPARFRRDDHLGDPSRPLADCVRDLVADERGQRPVGPVRTLTNLRYFGHCFNPVNFSLLLRRRRSRGRVGARRCLEHPLGRAPRLRDRQRAPVRR